MASIFLSYAGAERDTAIRIRNGLEAAGLNVWQDSYDIKAGDNWLDALQEALVNCSVFVILVGPSGISYWVKQELSFAFKRKGDEEGRFTIFPLLLPGVAPEDLPPFLTVIQARQVAAEPTHDDYQLIAEQIVSGAYAPSTPQEPDGQCPFAGLESFDEVNAAFFFGRQTEILEALSLFGLLGKGAERRWLQVEGPSGVGKSSLVKAGIIPTIRSGWVEDRHGLLPRNWRIAIMRPGNDPVLNMAEAVTRAFRTTADGPSLGEIKRRLQNEDPEALRDLIREYLPEKSRFLLVIDQLEEAFTHLKGLSRRQRMDTLVATALVDRDGPFYLMTTIRSDHTLDIGNLPQMESLLNQRAERYYLKPIGERGLQDVVSNSMRRAGLKWDPPTLGERIVRDAAGEANALPLVSNVLWLLWQRRIDNRLLTKAYEELGGVVGALARGADDLLAGLGKEGRRRAKHLLLRLIKIGSGGRPNRRMISRTTALMAAGGGVEAERILNRLAGGADSESGADPVGVRLIVISARETEPSDVDIVHEALLTDWGTLKRWIKIHSEQLIAEDALEEIAIRWKEAGRPRFPGVPSRHLLNRYRYAKAPSETARKYLRAVRKQKGLRSAAASLMAMVFTAALAFGIWINKEGISVRSGIYLLLASADIYYIQPEMVKIPSNSLIMEALDYDTLGSELTADPCGIIPHDLSLEVIMIKEDLMIGKFEVTFDEYDVFARLNNHIRIPSDYGWGRGRRPVIDVSWKDAIAYAQWLSEKTGKPYRLPSEIEWEHAARAGSTTAYWWGHQSLVDRANCWDCGTASESDNQEKKTVPVGSFPANNFGLHDTAGNVWEWVQDCWHNPKDHKLFTITSWETVGCSRRVIRGGAWNTDQCNVRSAIRKWSPADSGFEAGGFRLVR